MKRTKTNGPNIPAENYEKNIKGVFSRIFILFIVLLLYETFAGYTILTSNGLGYTLYAIIGVFGSTIMSMVLIAGTSRKLDEETKTIVPYRNTKNSSKSSDVIFYRIYEVVGGLSIYVASQGIIFTGVPDHLIILSPIQMASSDPLRFIVYLIFIVTSIQFMVGTAQHFELKSSLVGHHGIYSILNYVLIIWQAVSMLGMAEAIYANNLVLFAGWYILLLVTDTFWIYFYRIFRFQTFRFNRKLNKTVMSLTGTFFPPERVENTVHFYWIMGNFSYIMFLSVLEPLIYSNLTVTYQFMAFYFVLLSLLTGATTILNGKCLGALDLVK